VLDVAVKLCDRELVEGQPPHVCPNGGCHKHIQPSHHHLYVPRL